jgi:hypothetical protein
MDNIHRKNSGNLGISTQSSEDLNDQPRKDIEKDGTDKLPKVATMDRQLNRLRESEKITTAPPTKLVTTRPVLRDGKLEHIIVNEGPSFASGKSLLAFLDHRPFDERLKPLVTSVAKWLSYEKSTFVSANDAQCLDITRDLLTCLNAGHLDLSNWSARAVETMPTSLMAALAKISNSALHTAISKISLPPELKELPACLRSAEPLVQLSIAKYLGGILDLRPFQCCIALESLVIEPGFLQELHIFDGVNLSCEVLDKHKVVIHIYDPQSLEHLKKTVLHDTPYYRDDPIIQKVPQKSSGKTKRANFNGKAKFQNVDDFHRYNIIYCASLSIKLLINLALRRPGDPKFSMVEFSSKENIEKSVSPLMRIVCNWISRNSKSIQIRSIPMWGKHVYTIFSQMGKDGVPVKLFLFSSCKHAMVLGFKIKHEKNQVEYSILFYDPNETKDLQRLVTFDVEKSQEFNINQFMKEPIVRHYFGKNSPVYAICEFPELSLDFDIEEFAKNIEHQETSYEGKEGIIDLDHDDPARTSPSNLFQMMFHNIGALTEEVLGEALANEADPKKIFEILKVRRVGEGYGLDMALTLGNSNAIKAWGRCFAKVRENMQWSSRWTLLLLSRRQTGVDHGMCTALEENHVTAFREWRMIVDNAGLSGDEMYELLLKVERNTKGYPGLRAAVMFGHVEIVKEYVEMILQSPLSEKQKVHLLSGEFEGESLSKFVTKLSSDSSQRSKKQEAIYRPAFFSWADAISGTDLLSKKSKKLLLG